MTFRAVKLAIPEHFHVFHGELVSLVASARWPKRPPVRSLRRLPRIFPDIVTLTTKYL
jgi:hypothetical protein